MVFKNSYLHPHHPSSKYDTPAVPSSSAQEPVQLFMELVPAFSCWCYLAVGFRIQGSFIFLRLHKECQTLAHVHVFHLQ